MHIAARNSKNAWLVSLLLSHNADARELNEMCYSPLDIAIEHDAHEYKAIIEKHSKNGGN